MQTQTHVDVPAELIDAIRTVPTEREVEHCGEKFSASPFDIYATCPRCGHELKLRAFCAVREVEDVFDAVFEWLNRPGASDLMHRRQELSRLDEEE
jgi:hypothetical protein